MTKQPEKFGGKTLKEIAQMPLTKMREHMRRYVDHGYGFSQSDYDKHQENMGVNAYGEIDYEKEGLIK